MYLAQFRAGGRLCSFNIGLYGAVKPDLVRTETMKHHRRASAITAKPPEKEFGQRFLCKHFASHCNAFIQAEYKRSVETLQRDPQLCHAN